MLANDSSCWREFVKNRVTHSAAHYLMAIRRLHQEFGYARATDVAEELDVSRGAASMALAQLKRRGWVAEDPHRFLLLTEEGRRVTDRVEQNFVILSKFFEEVLGVPGEIAQADACKMEHLLSLETGRRLVSLMRFILSDEGHAALIRDAMGDFTPDDESVADYLLTEEDNEGECVEENARACEKGVRNG